MTACAVPPSSASGRDHPYPLTMAAWRVAGASVRGASHERSGLPNQDAVAWASVDAGVVVAVADGHGSPRSPHSDVGARLAVDTAVRLGGGFLEGEASALEASFVPALVGGWADAVRAEAAWQPGDDDLLPFGSTVLVALLGERTAGLVQLGDGDIVTVSSAGVAARPLPPDPRLIANQTTSLCTPTAVADVRVAAVDLAVVSLVLLSTDGYGNSFADDTGFLAAGPDLLARVEQDGLDDVAGQLPGWLAESAQVAGDDVTLAMAVRTD